MTNPPTQALLKSLEDCEAEAYAFVNPMPECETGKECDLLGAFKAGHAACFAKLGKALEEAMAVIEWTIKNQAVDREQIVRINEHSRDKCRAILGGE